MARKSAAPVASDPVDESPVDESFDVDTSTLAAEAEITSEPSPAPETTDDEQQQQPQSWRDLLAARGLTTDGDDDASAVESLVSHYQQLQPFAQYGYQARQHWNEFQQYMANRGQQYQPQQPAPEQMPQPRQYKLQPLPEYDPKWASALRRDEATGQLVPVGPFVDPSIVGKYQTYHEAFQERVRQLANDPVSLIEDQIQDRIDWAVQQHLQQYQQQAQQYQQRGQEVSYAQQEIAAQSPYLFVHNEQGQTLADPLTGQAALTDYGKAYTHFLMDAHQRGIYDSATQSEWAKGQCAMRGYYPQQPQQQATSAPGQSPDPRQRFMNRMNGAQRSPGRNGSARTDKNPDVPLNFLDEHNLGKFMTDMAREQGVLN